MQIVRALGGAFILALLVPGCYSGGGPNRNISAGAGPGGLAGAPAASYDVKRLDGSTDSLARHHGSIVVMNLWATWCPPCLQEVPDLQRFSQEYKKRGVIVLGIDQGESIAAASTFARAHGVSYPILVDEDQQYGRTYEAIGLPTTVVVDRTGHVVHGYDGPLTLAQMREAVAPALKGP
jgi:cytochrome c biogenesis protein CcmG/thiol:disulfide interchange protein DsbE